MMDSPFYIKELSEDLNSYELKSFRIQHDETQIVKYLVKFAKKHQKQLLNKTFLVRETGSDNLVAFYSFLHKNIIKIRFGIFKYILFFSYNLEG